MDGRTQACGGVAALRTVKNPISLARLVMEQTKHVLLASDGAEQFATEMRVQRVENSWFSTDKRRQELEQARQAENAAVKQSGMLPQDLYYGTVGCVALDAHGNLAAGTSTGGRTNKKFGRVGDSPINGAGITRTTPPAPSAGPASSRNSFGMPSRTTCRLACSISSNRSATPFTTCCTRRCVPGTAA